MSQMVGVVYLSFPRERKEMLVPKNKLCQSEFFAGMVDNIGCQEQPLIFPLQYSHVSDVYLSYLNGDDSKLQQYFDDDSCGNKGNVGNLFLFCHFIMDDIFLDNLVVRLYLSWTKNSNVLNYLSPAIIRDIYLHSPLALVPKSYHDDMIFLKSWTKHNINKDIHVQTNDHYYPFNSEITYYSNIKVHDDGQLISINSHCNRKPNFHLSRSNVRHGPQLCWYTPHDNTTQQQLMSYYYYEYDRPVGEDKWWHSTGQLQQITDHDSDTGRVTSRYIFDESGNRTQFLFEIDTMYY